jgi:hypothetical protein
VEDIDMTEEIASVASDSRKGAVMPHHTKGVEFASNILNDMGPPQALCSALLLAANAACRPSSSHCSLRSFDTKEGIAPDSDAVSDVVAHLDTVCCFHMFCILHLPRNVRSPDDNNSLYAFYWYHIISSGRLLRSIDRIRSEHASQSR